MNTNNNESKTFYCSQKFWWLSVDIDRSQILSCCTATPENIDINWLESNPGKLFNTPGLQHERSLMLQNIPVSSCRQNCWNPEDRGLPSRRILMGSNNITHDNINSDPKVMHLILGNDCNMSCVYCCKQYSSSWARDILDHGPYQVTVNDDRYQINALDKVLLRLSQKEIGRSSKRDLLFKEIAGLEKKDLREITITGGEPFLSLFLQHTVESLACDTTIKIWSGLGVDPNRFKKECEKIRDHNIEIVISAENIDDFYEFNRSGNTWKRFCQNIDTLDNLGLKYSFNATISNLTLFGLSDFVTWVNDRNMICGICNDPDFLSPNVLDDISRQLVMERLSDLPDKVQQIITKSFSTPASPELRQKLKIFLKEYATRKQKSLDIFPKHFLDWIAG